MNVLCIGDAIADKHSSTPRLLQSLIIAVHPDGVTAETRWDPERFIPTSEIYESYVPMNCGRITTWDLFHRERGFEPYVPSTTEPEECHLQLQIDVLNRRMNHLYEVLDSRGILPRV